MLIRKKFIINSSTHIVKNCSSNRCKYSYHSHSPVVEVFIEGQGLDNAEMLVDFGLLTPYKEFLKIFNKTLMIWSKDHDTITYSQKYANYCNKDTTNIRYCVLPFNPSAERLALYYHYIFDKILKHTKFKNGESLPLKISKVYYHETKSGKAVSEYSEMLEYSNEFTDVILSDGIKESNINKNVIDLVLGSESVEFENPNVMLQIK